MGSDESFFFVESQALKVNKTWTILFSFYFDGDNNNIDIY